MYFENIPVIPYEGPQSKNPLAFKYYNPDQIIMGKPMSEHLPFAMAWWHNLCAGGMLATLSCRKSTTAPSWKTELPNPTMR